MALSKAKSRIKKAAKRATSKAQRKRRQETIMSDIKELGATEREIYVVVRMTIDDSADPTEVIDNCDYWFQHEEDIKRTEIVDWGARRIFA